MLSPASSPSDDAFEPRPTAVWDRDAGTLIAFNAPFATFIDFSPSRLRDATTFAWTRLGAASFLHEDTKQIVEDSLWRLQSAIDFLASGAEHEILETDLQLVSAAGILKWCDIRIALFSRGESSDCVQWVIESVLDRPPPDSPPVRPPAIALDLQPASAPSAPIAMQRRGMGVVSKFSWKAQRPPRKPAAPRPKKRVARRLFAALDLDYAHPYSPRVAAPTLSLLPAVALTPLE